MQKVEGKNPLHRLRGYHLFVGISVSDLGFDVYSSRYTPMKFLVFLLIPAFSFAQHQHSSDPDSARFDLAKLPAPQPMSGLGQAHIAITTSSPAAQRWFDQGLAALHCFWDYEAMRAFEQAVRLDPDCAMCHWGLARALDSRGGDKEQQKAELKKAEDLASKASDHEQRYIRADVAAAKKEDEKDDDSA